jgi:hypothetical protein
MKRQNKKSILDEMQNQKLLKLEEIGFWILFWALFLSIAVQLIAGGTFRDVFGEIVILFIGSVYLLFASLKNGLWMKTAVPTRKGNAIISILPAIIIAVVNGIRIVLNKAIHTKSLLTVTAFVLATYLICFVVLELFRTIYKTRRTELDEPDEESEE